MGTPPSWLCVHPCATADDITLVLSAQPDASTATPRLPSRRLTRMRGRASVAGRRGSGCVAKQHFMVSGGPVQLPTPRVMRCLVAGPGSRATLHTGGQRDMAKIVATSPAIHRGRMGRFQPISASPCHPRIRSRIALHHPSAPPAETPDCGRRGKALRERAAGGKARFHCERSVGGRARRHVNDQRTPTAGAGFAFPCFF